MSSASATGIAIVIATRAERLWLLRRRGAGLCPENIQPTSPFRTPNGRHSSPSQNDRGKESERFLTRSDRARPCRDSGNFLTESFRISNVAGQTICYRDEIVLLLAAEYGRYHSNVTDRLRWAT